MSDFLFLISFPKNPTEVAFEQWDFKNIYLVISFILLSWIMTWRNLTILTVCCLLLSPVSPDLILSYTGQQDILD